MEKDSKIIRVLVADDQDLVRQGFEAILNTYPNIEVVATASNGLDAVEKASALKPDVVLMDIRMPVENGIDATRDITENPALEDTNVLVLTTFDIDQYVYDALEAGASGFLLKDAAPNEVAKAIEVVASGDALIQPSVMTKLVKEFVASRKGSANAKPSDSDLSKRVSELTQREREILQLIAKGKPNDEIASELFISPATVKTHVSRILAKLQAHDRAQLVVFAYESGMVVAQGQEGH